MKLLVVAVVAFALFSVAVCDDEHGEESYEGGYGEGEGVSEEGGDGDGHATPIVHEGHVVSKVFGAPPSPGYHHVPIPDVGYDRYVIHKPGHHHPLVKKGEGFGYSHHHH